MKFCPACGSPAGILETPTGTAQGPQGTSSQQAPVSIVPQSPPPKKSSLPVVVLAVVVLGLGPLIFLLKDEVIPSLKSPAKVTASQNTAQEIRSEEGPLGVLPGTSPESSVILFYNLISKGQYADAYELFSMNRKGRVLRDNFLGGFRNTLSTNVIGLEKYYQDNSFATVAIRVVSLDRSTTGGPDVKKAFQGEWTLVNVGGYWLLDKSNIKQVPDLPGE